MQLTQQLDTSSASIEIKCLAEFADGFGGRGCAADEVAVVVLAGAVVDYVGDVGAVEGPVADEAVCGAEGGAVLEGDGRGIGAGGTCGAARIERRDFGCGERAVVDADVVDFAVKSPSISA